MTDDTEVDTERLYATTDAAIWVEEFAKVCPEVDEGLMIGWFASAIETAMSLTKAEKDPRVVYQATPDIYEFDLRLVVDLIDGLNLAARRVEDVFVEEGNLVLWSKNDYSIGRLHFDGDQWVFTPHNESDVPAEES